MLVFTEPMAQKSGGPVSARKACGEGGDLDRVAQRRAGAVAST